MVGSIIGERMARTVPEWIGANENSRVPRRVMLRIFEKSSGRCSVCSRRIGGSLRPVYDHIIAIINGGENRESNLRLLCYDCHFEKTRADVHEKSMVYRRRLRHFGIKPRRGKPMLGSKDSGWKHKLDGTWVKRG